MYMLLKRFKLLLAASKFYPKSIIRVKLSTKNRPKPTPPKRW